ncbi:MAG TPA: hypothetical protein VFS34_13290 [Thermoanaerobaculia bacterium]|nr:hypothetical protein [Thermoanaerobaculia bacterium]
MKRSSPLVALLLAIAAVAAAGEPAGEFTATARVETRNGTRSTACTIIVNRPIPYEEAAPLRKLLEEGGQQAVRAAILGAARGQLSLGGIAYPLDLVIFEPKGNGFRYVVVTSRPIRWEESELGESSLDYPFTVLVFEEPAVGLGEGQICPRAALEIDEDGHVRAVPHEGRMGVLNEIRRH